MDASAKDRGRRAEERAARHLRSLGLEILARNVRTKSGEIDVVAREGPTLVIVEVRYRREHVVGAWRSLSAAKRDRLMKAAREAQAALRIPGSVPVRFDVVLACGDARMVHIRGALQPSRPYAP
jgi:putative endonuclease